MKRVFAISFLLLIFTLTYCKESDNNPAGNDNPGNLPRDADGNVYNTITIGTQTWMAQNLKTTKYRNGEAIPNVTDSAAWDRLKTGAYCKYNNSNENGNIFGNLYNYYAAIDSRKICPSGWHVPSKAEFETLKAAVNNNRDALLATSQGNGTGTNTSGFSALFGGCRGFYLGLKAFFWSTTDNNAEIAGGMSISNYSSDINVGYFYKEAGLSIRCIKD